MPRGVANPADVHEIQARDGVSTGWLLVLESVLCERHTTSGATRIPTLYRLRESVATLPELDSRRAD